jgi:glycosyltransferase involved in cell wall biosynthesis
MRWTVVFEHNLANQTANRTHILEFCHALAKVDDVTFISQADNDQIDPDFGFTYRKVAPVAVWPHTFAGLLSTIKLLFYLWKLHRFQKINVLYVRPSAFGLGPLLFARLARIPGILEINGAWREEARLTRGHFPPWKRVIFGPVTYLRGWSVDMACHLATHIVTVTPQLASYLQNQGIDRRKIAVVSNGANIERFTPLDKESCKRSLGLDGNLRYIGFVGGLAPWQGLDHLIKAFSQIVGDYQECRLLIVGDGIECEPLIRLSQSLAVEKRVIFTGAKPHSQVPTYIGACDILTVPKKPLVSGYSPLKVYEYMACGRPVLASAVPGLEFVGEKGIGFLFEPGNVADLAAGLKKLLDIPERDRQEIGRLARQIALDQYSWDAIAAQVRALVQGK